MNDGLFSYLGEGWFGKVLALALGGAATWIAKGPAERASIMLAVDKRVETAMTALERQLQAAHDRCDALSRQHEQCERDLDAIRKELRAAIPSLMAGPVAPDYTKIIRPKP